MRVNLAAGILAMLGPGRVLHAGAEDAATLSELLLAGCDAWATGSRPVAHPRWLAAGDGIGPYDTLLLETRSGRDWLQDLRGALQAHGLPRALALRAPGLDRTAADAVLFAAGWRRHPAALSAALYPGLRCDTLGEFAFYQPLPVEAGTRWPLAELRRDGAKLTDPLREGGGAADARLARYAVAAQLVRPGDTVLEAGCGTGSGLAAMAAMSRGGRFIGLDPDPDAIEYARANHGGVVPDFIEGGVSALRSLPAASIDLLVSIDAPELHDLLPEFRRVLRPDGRLFVSTPAGGDSWPRLRAGLQHHFLVEARYGQTVPGGSRLPNASRALYAVAQDAEAEAEWWMAIASVDPLAEGLDRRTAFRHPAFEAAYEVSGAALVSFSRDYDNPYLYRSMVQLGERLMDDGQLIGLAGRAVAEVRPGSADQGAAICVLGYRVLESRDPDAAIAVIRSIASYVEHAVASPNAHVARWRISLAFLAGRLAALRGDRDAAIAWYRCAAEPDWRRFSPLLATKAVAAAFHEGMLHVVGDDLHTARRCFERGVADALDAARGDQRTIVGSLSAPIPFGLVELAEVLDMGSQCANALAAMPLIERDRGLFWRQIDVRRFGMMSWGRAIEGANAELRRRNGELEAELRRTADQLRAMQSANAQLLDVLRDVRVSS